MIPMDLRVGVEGEVVGAGRRGKEQGRLLEAEHLQRPALGAAVGAQPGCGGTPLLGPPLGVGQVNEALTGEERAPDVLDLAFDLRLVLRRAHPGRVDHETPGLGVLQESVVEARLDIVGLGDDGRHVVGDDHSEDASEEFPRRLEALDDRGGGLAVAEPHETVPGVAGGEDQCLNQPLPAAGRVGDQAHAPEIDLDLRSRLAVVDPHRGLSLPEPAALSGETIEGAVGDDNALAGQQVLNLDQPQPLVEPHLNLGLVGDEGLPPGPVAGGAGRADRLARHTDHHVAQLLLATASGEPGADGRLHVATDRLAVHADQPVDTPVTLTPQPQPQHLFDLEHRYLPESHGHPSPG